MTRIRRAYQADLDDINSLLEGYSINPVTRDCINDKDIAVVACEAKRVVGFVWCGLMAKNTVGYLANFVVAQDCAGSGVGERLLKHTLEVLKKKSVKQVFGTIKQDEYHDKSAYNALKIAMGADKLPHTYVTGNVQKMVQEVGI